MLQHQAPTERPGQARPGEFLDGWPGTWTLGAGKEPGFYPRTNRVTEVIRTSILGQIRRDHSLTGTFQPDVKRPLTEGSEAEPSQGLSGGIFAKGKSMAKHRAESQPDSVRRALLLSPIYGISLAAIARMMTGSSGPQATVAMPIPETALIDRAADGHKTSATWLRDEFPPHVTRNSETRNPVSTPKNSPKPAPSPTTHTQPIAQPKTTGTTRPKIVLTAKDYLGIPYVYGGTTTRGFDCSGYTRYVYDKVGLYLPRTSEQQATYTNTTRSPLPGDLVFFWRGSDAYHVGIYAGSGMMYAAPHTGDVTKLQTIYSSSVSYGRHPRL